MIVDTTLMSIHHRAEYICYGMEGASFISRKKISFVVPVFNEQDTISLLAEEVISTVSELNYDFEILFVDDGSSDRSWKEIEETVSFFAPFVRGIRMRHNFGKATALAAGFAQTDGDIVVTMDADLQDMPQEIPKFIEKIEAGYDLVTGWKKMRHDPFSKTFPSLIFNQITSMAIGLKLHDFNCGFKAYRREVVNAIELYGELHRFTPALAHAYGFKITEIPVLHSDRKFGKSKYGIKRIFHGIMDLFTVLITTRFINRPNHFLGGTGLISGFIGALTLFYLFCVKFIGHEAIGHRPLLSFGIMMVVLSVQLVSIGLVAELVTRGSRTRDVAHLIARKAAPFISSSINDVSKRDTFLEA